MIQQFLFKISFLLVSFFLVSCLENRPASLVLDLQAPTSWFDGVKSVQNLGGFPVSVQVNWDYSPLAQKYRVYAITMNPVTNSIGFNLIEEISDPFTTSYTHRDATTLSPGLIYTYRVNAVDSLGVEDNNAIQKSTVAFEGIGRVEIVSKTSARVTINSSGSFSSLKVIAHPTRLSPSDLSQDVSLIASSSQNIITLNNLRPGTTYSFKAWVLVNTQGDVDGNDVTVRAQTPSDSYGTGDQNETASSYQYRSVRLVQAFGDAPHALNNATLATAPAELDDLSNPSVRMIKIIPNQFSGQHSGKYRVVRTAGIGLTGNSAPLNFNTAATNICKPPTATRSATEDSCVVCDHNSSRSPNDLSAINNGECDLNINAVPPTFSDKSLSPPPKKYFYTISKVNEFDSQRWPEELPLNNATEFLFAAHVPDQYMVLVQRDSVNYEMCSMLSKTPDPRKSNRCAYKGIAATPYNTKGVKLELDSGYYDFGYNLFVDRYALSCNWTRPSAALPNPCGNSFGCFSIGANNNGTFSGDAANNSTPVQAYIPTPSFTAGTAYADSPLGLFNLQSRGNNCFARYFDTAEIQSGNPADSRNGATVANGAWTSIGALANLGLNLSDSTQVETKNQIKKIVKNIATADPGPLGSNYSDRKRPVITGLTNTQAQSLCNTQSNVYGGKRLMRRRESIVATPLPSLAGEPGFTTLTNLNLISNGTPGQTLYDWSSASDGTKIGNGLESGKMLNPGSCSTSTSPALIVSNPKYCDTTPNGLTCSRIKNSTVPRLSLNYCNNISGCNITESADTLSSSFVDGTRSDFDNNIINFNSTTNDYITSFLDPRNEVAHLHDLRVASGNGFSSQFFIGSLATNKCTSRFGLQDPFSTSGVSSGGAFATFHNTSFGYILSDQFIQRATTNMNSTSPVFESVSNPLDLGVAYDYKYNNGANSIQFSNTTSGYSSVGINGNESITCTDTDNSNSQTWYRNNFFYLTSTTTNSTVISCATPNGANSSAYLATIAQKSETDFSGFLPILGLPLSNAKNINSDQDQMDFSGFLYGNQFAQSSSSRRTYARFLASTNAAGNTVVNMSTGTGGRWSYEISESGSINNAGSAWCAQEAE